MSSNSVDIKKIKKPTVHLSSAAGDQLKLILANDYTIKDRKFRVFIKGKGCEGFTYDTIFDEMTQNDILISTGELEIILDPFSAFFLEEFGVDFIFDPINDLEGFVVANKNQDKFTGKFWTKGKVELPPLIKTGLESLQDSPELA